MIILMLTNNASITDLLTDWLCRCDNTVITFGKPISVRLFSKLSKKDFCPDIIISYNYIHIIKQDVIDFMEGKVINMHISLLPWNRGFDPNFWSFIEDTPKGITIHLLDAGLDTGDVLLQKEINFDEDIETLGSSYRHLHNQMQQVFKDNWDEIKSFNIMPTKQVGKGTLHYKKETKKIRQQLGNEMWKMPIGELRRYYADI